MLEGLACLGWGLVEPGQRRRMSALRRRIGGLTADLKDFELRWREAVTSELHWEAHRRLESLSRVPRLAASQTQR